MGLYILFGVTFFVFIFCLKEGVGWRQTNRSLKRNTIVKTHQGPEQISQSLQAMNRAAELVRKRNSARISFFALLVLFVPLAFGCVSAGLTAFVQKKANNAHLLGYRFNDAHTMAFLDHLGNDLVEIPRADFRFVYFRGRQYTPPLWMERFLGMDPFVVIYQVDLASDGLTVIPGSLTKETPAEIKLRESGKMDLLFTLPENALTASGQEYTAGPFKMHESGGWINLLPSGPIHTAMKEQKQ